MLGSGTYSIRNKSDQNFISKDFELKHFGIVKHDATALYITSK